MQTHCTDANAHMQMHMHCVSIMSTKYIRCTLCAWALSYPYAGAHTLHPSCAS